MNTLTLRVIPFGMSFSSAQRLMKKPKTKNAIVETTMPSTCRSRGRLLAGPAILLELGGKPRRARPRRGIAGTAHLVRLAARAAAARAELDERFSAGDFSFLEQVVVLLLQVFARVLAGVPAAV